MQVLGVAAAYYAGTVVSVLTTPQGIPVTSLWISSGIGLFCLLSLGVRIWPGILLGSFVSNVSAVPPLEALLVALANTLAPVCAYVLLRHVGFRLELDRIKDALAFVVLAAFGAMSVSASIGTLALVAAEVLPASKFLQGWTVWWSSDVLGVLVVTPLLLVARRLPQVAHVSRWRLFEFSCLLLATLAITAYGAMRFGELFLAFPLIVLAALRFQLNGVAPCALIASAVAINVIARGNGVLERSTSLTDILILQAFNGTLVLTGLLLAVVITEWRNARAEVERTYFKLAEVVERLQRSMLPGYEPYSQHRERSLRASIRSHDRRS